MTILYPPDSQQRSRPFYTLAAWSFSTVPRRWAETLRHSSDDAPKLGVLGVNSMHIIEHYGNLVTYMRMKNIVPPTSEPGAKAEPKE